MPGDKDRKLTVIRPKERFFKLNIKETWEYRDLIFLFVRRNLSVQYKQTILGPLWLIIAPVISALVSSFVFGTIAQIESGEVPYFAFYFAAYVAWSYFSTCLSSTSSTFSGNAVLFRRVYFPRIVVPVSNVLTALFSFFVHFALMVIILFIYWLCGARVQPVWELIWLIPLLVVEMAALALGCGAIISAITAKYRDLGRLVGLGLEAWKYLTPVVYAASSLSGVYHTLILLNPMAPVMEAFRYVILGSGGGIHVAFLLASAGETLFILLIGLLIFNHTERTFVDTV